VKGMNDAGLGTQMGYLGWTAAARGERPRYDSFPTGGMFRYCRQPIYAAFALTLWTGPVLTPDRLALAVLWTTYCLVGPLLKERRYLRRHGEAFREYQASVPYWLPARPRAVAPATGTSEPPSALSLGLVAAGRVARRSLGPTKHPPRALPATTNPARETWTVAPPPPTVEVQ